MSSWQQNVHVLLAAGRSTFGYTLTLVRDNSADPIVYIIGLLSVDNHRNSPLR